MSSQVPPPAAAPPPMMTPLAPTAPTSSKNLKIFGGCGALGCLGVVAFAIIGIVLFFILSPSPQPERPYPLPSSPSPPLTGGPTPSTGGLTPKINPPQPPVNNGPSGPAPGPPPGVPAQPAPQQPPTAPPTAPVPQPQPATGGSLDRFAKKQVGRFTLTNAARISDLIQQGATDAIGLIYSSPDGGQIQVLFAAYPTEDGAVNFAVSATKGEVNQGGSVVSQKPIMKDGQQVGITIELRRKDGKAEVLIGTGKMVMITIAPNSQLAGEFLQSYFS